MDKLLTLVVDDLAIILYVLITHIPFNICLSDDIEFKCGRKVLRHKRKKNKTNIFVRFTFWDFRKDVIRWHYIIFWINLLSNMIIFLLSSIQIFFSSEVLEFVISLLAVVSIVSLILILPVRFNLYKYNRIRKRK